MIRSRDIETFAVADIVSMVTDNANVFPLYLYSEKDGVVEKKANLNPEIVAKIGECLKTGLTGSGVGANETVLRVTHAQGCAREVTSTTDTVQPSTFNLQPEDIFHYVYAVLHTPSYRARYREFLKVDFPRIPYPASAEQFRRLAAIGAELVQVHLLKAPSVRQTFSPVAAFQVQGDNRVEKVTFEDGRVYISATQYFDNVPQAAWEFFIGGYQPAQKWLKDRKGRVLSYDDTIHYKSIILALLETRRLMDAAEDKCHHG